jgi:hypothetical protein
MYAVVYASIVDARPSLLMHTWANWQGGPLRQMIIRQQDPNFTLNEQYHVGIRRYGNAPVTYRLVLKTLDAATTDESTAPSTETASETTLPPDMVVCDHCGASVPERSITLHRNFCQRNHVRCEKCGEVTRVGEATERHWHCEACDFVSNAWCISSYDSHIFSMAMYPYVANICGSCILNIHVFVENALRQYQNCRSI